MKFFKTSIIAGIVIYLMMFLGSVAARHYLDSQADKMIDAKYKKIEEI